jgi:hypothetical protein
MYLNPAVRYQNLSASCRSCRSEAVAAWTDHVSTLGQGLLSNEVNSWMTGVNSKVEGRQTPDHALWWHFPRRARMPAACARINHWSENRKLTLAFLPALAS